LYAIFDDGKLITFEGDCEVGKIIHASVVKDQKDLQKKEIRQLIKKGR